MVRTVLNIVLALSLVLSPGIAPAQVVEDYPFHELGFVAGVCSGRTWVNLSPLALPEEVISPQIYPLQFGGLLLRFDLDLKKETQRFLVVSEVEVPAQFRVWLEPEAVNGPVQFAVKVEGINFPPELVEAISERVNHGQEFYLLRRAVYWFYKGRALRERLGWTWETGQDKRSLLKAVGTLPWEYLKDWIGEDDSVVGGIWLPNSVGYTYVSDEEARSLLTRIEESSLLLDAQKTVFYLLTAFRDREKGSLFDLEGLLKEVEEGKHPWLARGLDVLAFYRPSDEIEKLKEAIFFPKDKEVAGSWKDVKRFFDVLYQVYPREMGRIVKAIRDSALRMKEGDVYRFASLYLLEKEGISVFKEMDNALIKLWPSEVEKVQGVFPGLSKEALAFVSGYTTPSYVSWEGEDNLRAWFYWGRLMKEAGIWRGESFVLDQDTLFDAIQGIANALERNYTDTIRFLIEGLEEKVLDEPWILPHIETFGNAVISLMSQLDDNSLFGVFSSIAEENPGTLALVITSPYFAQFGIGQEFRRAVSKLPFSKKLFMWSLYPERSPNDRVFVELGNVLLDELRSMNSPVSEVIKADEKDPLLATALLDFLALRSKINPIQLKELFEDERLSFPTRLRAGLYWLKYESQEDVLEDVWGWIEREARPKLEELLNEGWMTDFEFINQRWKTVLPLITVMLWSKMTEVTKDVPDEKRIELLLHTLNTKLVSRPNFWANSNYEFGLFYILNLMRYQSDFFSPLAIIFAHEVGHNISWALLFPERGLEEIRISDGMVGALAELIADFSGIAFCEAMGIKDLDGFVRLAVKKMLPLDTINFGREITIHEFNRLIMRYAVKISQDKRHGLGSFLTSLRKVLAKARSEEWLRKPTIDIQKVYEKVFSYLSGDTNFARDLIAPFGEALRESKLVLAMPNGSGKARPESRMDAYVPPGRVSRRELLKKVLTWGGGSAFILGNIAGAVKVLERLSRTDLSGPGSVEHGETIEEGSKESANQGLSPERVLSEIERRLESKRTFSPKEAEEIVVMFNDLFDFQGRPLVSLSEFRRLLYLAGSKDESLALRVFEEFYARVGDFSNLNGFLPTLSTVQEAREITLAIVKSARHGLVSDDAKIRLLKVLNRYFVRELKTELRQDFFEFLKNPFWVYPVVLAQRYMAKRGLDYDLNLVMAFAIKEGYDKIGAAMKRGEWRGVEVTNAYPMGLDRFGSRKVREDLVKKGWLPKGFVEACVEETDEFMHNRLESFPLVRFVSTDVVLGGEYPALVAMIAMIKQDQEEMFRGFRWVRSNWNRFGSREKAYLLYLFYNSSTRDKRRVLSRVKDLLLTSPQDLPGWLMRSRLRGREVIQHEKAVKTVALAESLLPFLPEEQVDRTKLERLTMIRKYLSGLISLGVSGMRGKTRGKQEVDVKAVAKEVEALLDAYSSKEGKKRSSRESKWMKMGFVNAFRSTRFYAILSQFSDLLVKNESEARRYFDQVLFPLLSSEDVQKGVFDDEAPGPRWSEQEKSAFTMQHLGDMFLYRLAGIHGFANIRRQEGEDEDAYRKRLWAFFRRWTVLIGVVRGLKSLEAYIEKGDKARLFLLKLDFFVELAEKDEHLDPLERELADWQEVVGETTQRVFAPLDLGETEGAKRIGLPLGVDSTDGSLCLLLPISPDVALAYGRLSEIGAGVGTEEKREIFAVRRSFLDYGKKASEFLNKVFVWDGEKASKWERDRDKSFLWKARAKWVEEEDLPRELLRIMQSGFKPVNLVKDKEGRFAILVEEGMKESESEEKIETALVELGVDIPDELEKDWEKEMFLGELGIGRENIEFKEVVYDLGLDRLEKVKERLEQIRSLAEEVRREVKSAGGILLGSV